MSNWTPEDRGSAPMDAEVVELALLLPRWQAMALESAARKRNMTTGQMLRRLLGEMLTGPQPNNG
ncbi:hypothetical protein [Tuwongella immobilis]|uniref:Uncharacterized protein n=1 Tax=Tuwongella immobilis TaxID=692036 RepID=A0A6C2YTE7_9BACT|nr:hypothetical protein [Tuwongella immobilis]VIP04162.1 unnamed protein product [Tuwongella immobilis]VTS05689.1 unnamed protein product [Tuwongella immobilis]